MNGPAHQIGGTGAIIKGPKPAPKPRPQSSGDNLLQLKTNTIPSSSLPKPTLSRSSPKQPPDVSAKPKPEPVQISPKPNTPLPVLSPKPLVVSPKPPVLSPKPPVLSPKPHVLSPKPKVARAKPETPTSPLVVSPPGVSPVLTNGGSPRTPSLVKTQKPKPPVKRKSWLNSPQQSFDLAEDAAQTDRATDAVQASNNENFCSSEQKQNDIEVNHVPAQEIDHTKRAVSGTTIGGNDLLPNRDEQSPTETVNASESVENLGIENATSQQSPCEAVSESRSENSGTDLLQLVHSVTDSNSPLNPSVNAPSGNDRTPQINKNGTLAEKSERLPTLWKDTAPTVKATTTDPCSCTDIDVSSCGEHRKIERSSSVSDDAPCSSECDNSQDAAAEDISEEHSTKQSEQRVVHVGTQGPAPKASLSSVSSVTSSIDTYDFLNNSRSSNSFKSQRSSQSVRSQASSQPGSDSEEECGVFKINEDIPEESLSDDLGTDSEEDELVVEATPVDRPHIGSILHSSGDEAAGHSGPCIAFEEEGGLIDDQDFHRETIQTDHASEIRDTDEVGNSVKGPLCVYNKPSDNDDAKIHESYDALTVDNAESSNCSLFDGQKSDPSSDIPELEGPLHTTHVTGATNTDVYNCTIEGELVQNSKTEDKISSDSETTESDSSIDQEEEEFDKMGKRVFSFSRQKKQGGLKYSPGEFHEQYDRSGNGKLVPDGPKGKDAKKKLKRGKKNGQEKEACDTLNTDISEVCVEDINTTMDEDRPSKPPRMRPKATPEELEVGRSSTSDMSTSPLADEDAKPLPAPRWSLTRHSKNYEDDDRQKPTPKPRLSLSGMSSQTSVENANVTKDNTCQNSSDLEDGIEDDVFDVMSGGAGSVVTHRDTDGEEAVIIGGMPSSSTQTAFADQVSMDSSEVDASTDEFAEDDGRPFHHYATIEPLGDNDDCGKSSSAFVDTSSTTPAYGDTLTTTSENPSVSISFAGSEVLSDSTEFISPNSEHAVTKPWSEMASVTVAVTTMPEPLVPEFTHVAGDSSTTTSASSLVASCQNPQQDVMQPENSGSGLCTGEDQPSKNDSVDEDEDEDEGEDEDTVKEENIVDGVDVYDESYKKRDWKYRESQEEINIMTQPEPETEEEAAEARDSLSHLSESSNSTTPSEMEFRASFSSRPHRIQRSRGGEDYVRLSKISRERKVVLTRQDGTFGLRIQKSKPVVITSLDPGGPGETAGLKVGDMITMINGQDVRQARHAEVVRLATEAPEPLVLVVGTVVCNSLNLSGDKTIMSGFMHKLSSSGVIKQWRRRWYVLKHDNCLYYYKSQNDVLPQGAIVLQNYTVTKARDAGKQFSFKLTKVGARTHYFYTASDEEMSSWGKAISEAASMNQRSDIWLDISTHNVSLPALSIKDPECHGFLNKWSGKMKNPRRRYCVVKDACLYYYKDMNALSAQGVVHLHGYSIQEMELKGKKFAFVLKPPDDDLREFSFFADHETDRKRWVSCLAASIGRWIQTNSTDDADDDGTEMLI